MRLTKNSPYNESPIGTYFLGVSLAMMFASMFVDIHSGGKIRESLLAHNIEYGLIVSFVIATSWYVMKGSPGGRFIRSYSRHGL